MMIQYLGGLQTIVISFSCMKGIICEWEGTYFEMNPEAPVSVIIYDYLWPQMTTSI